MVKQGDEFAAMVVEAMAYQICKEIGAMPVCRPGRARQGSGADGRHCAQHSLYRHDQEAGG